jgi:hypothetical protein
MKKKLLLLSIYFFVVVSIFAQSIETSYLSYESDIVIKKEGVYWLVELQSFKVNSNQIAIKGRTIFSF